MPDPVLVYSSKPYDAWALQVPPPSSARISTTNACSGSFCFQICSLLWEYGAPHGTVRPVCWLTGRLMLAQGPQHATQGLQPGLELRSNRFFEVWRSEARCQVDLTALKKQTAVVGCMSASTGIISGPSVVNGKSQSCSSGGSIPPQKQRDGDSENLFLLVRVRNLSEKTETVMVVHLRIKQSRLEMLVVLCLQVHSGIQ